MKKVFLTLTVIFMAVAANAQVWMGGSLGFNRSLETETSMPVIDYSIAPEIGFSIAPKLDLAFSLTLAGETQKSEVISNARYVETAIAIQPYVRFKAINCGKVGFFVDGGIEYGHVTEKVIIGNEVEKEAGSYFMVGLRPGISFAASDNITFAARIGSFGYYKVIDGASNFGLNVDNTAVTFGVWWTL